MKLKPRYYQEEAKQKIIDYLVYSPNKHPLIAMPTGTGKSLVIAMVIEFVRKEWDINVLVLSHTEEILKQDYKTIRNLIDEPIGVYSAGLNSKTILPITIAGIQSCFRKPELFAQFDLVIIDEAHLINVIDETMYKKFLSEVGQVYCGLTATPYRLGSGLIYGKDDTLFDSLIYDLTSMKNFNRLISEKFLCPLKTMETKLQLETDNLHHRGGEFIDREMSDMFNRESITKAAVNEIVRIGNELDYKKWLIFAIDIYHAESIAEHLIKQGIFTGVIHSKMEDDRVIVLDKHRTGKYKAMVNVNMLTTGYDDSEIDLIVMLRPTESPVLHVQSVGRGTRVSPNKDHCLVLDFAGNTKRLGPINNVVVKESYKLKESIGEPITKTCPECRLIQPPALKVCDCGYEFQFKTKLETSSTGYEIIATDKTWYSVENVIYNIILLSSGIEAIQAHYRCMSGFKVFTELFCLNHSGYARDRAINILSYRGADKSYLKNCKEAMSIIETLTKPTRILVKHDKKYPEIIKYDYK